MELSNVQEDYVKTVWTLEQTAERVKMHKVALRMGVKSPTVAAMFNSLEKLNLIVYDRKEGARLTETGRRAAEGLIRKHRLIETFLQKVLDIEEPLLHEEAEKLEHVISDQVIMKIDAYLGYPLTDPHGSLIPLDDDRNREYFMDELKSAVKFKVTRIPIKGNERTFCLENGFSPGSYWQIEQIGPRNESFLVYNGDRFLAISDHLAAKIKILISREMG